MIAVDVTFVSDEEVRSGVLSCSIPIFLSEILDEIVTLGYSENFILLVNSNAKKLISKRFPHFRVVSVGGFIARISFQIFGKQLNGFFRKNSFFEKTLMCKGIEHVWYPYLLPESMFGEKIDYVGTCHDLMRVNSNYTGYEKIFKSSTKIITVSNYVKKEIETKFNLTDKKISVVHNSIKLADSEVRTQEVKGLVPGKYILDVNSYSPRKNTITMLKAFNRIKDKLDDDLVLCGGYKEDSYYEECENFIRDNDLHDRVHMYLAVSDEERNWLFNNCKLFVMPSENEGFGRTPVEAAVCLKPVISTRATSLEEATCGMVNYYDDPRNDQELAQTIIKVLSNPAQKNELETIRRTFIENYAPQNIANQYIEIFHGLGWLDRNKKRREKRKQL